MCLYCKYYTSPHTGWWLPDESLDLPGFVTTLPTGELQQCRYYNNFVNQFDYICEAPLNFVNQECDLSNSLSETCPSYDFGLQWPPLQHYASHANILFDFNEPVLRETPPLVSGSLQTDYSCLLPTTFPHQNQLHHNSPSSTASSDVVDNQSLPSYDVDLLQLSKSELRGEKTRTEREDSSSARSEKQHSPQPRPSRKKKIRK